MRGYLLQELESIIEEQFSDEHNHQHKNGGNGDADAEMQKCCIIVLQILFGLFFSKSIFEGGHTELYRTS